MTAELERAAAPSVARRVGAFALRALKLELRIYSSIGRFIARRPAIAPGAAGFGYHKPVFTILMIFIVLSAVEIPIIDLIVHRWPVVRITFLVLGLGGMVVPIGGGTEPALALLFFAGPHVVLASLVVTGLITLITYGGPAELKQLGRIALGGIIGFAILNGWTQGILDDINEVSVQVVNLVVGHRNAMKGSQAA